MSFHFVSRERPLCPGASVGVQGGEPGTITAIVRRRNATDSSLYALSCEHVLKPKNIRKSSSIVQPATQDSFGTGNNDRVGKTVFTAGLNAKRVNTIDAALVKLNSSVKGQNYLRDANLNMLGLDTETALGKPVVMVGRSSGIQEGVVTDIEASETVDYERLGWSKSMLFSGVIKANYANAGGDSGAPVLNPDTGELVGLHFGGLLSQGVWESYFCPIQHVFDSLNIELI